MRTTLRICGLLLGFVVLSAPVAHAATTQSLAVSGTSAIVSLAVATPGARPDCTVDILVNITASASVQRTTGAASTGAFVFVQRLDTCTDLLEIGSADVSFPSNGFVIGSGSVTLNATIPVVMQSFGPDGGTVTRTLVASGLKLTNVENNTVSSRSFEITRSPAMTVIKRGRSVVNAAGIGGTLSLDGRNLVTTQASSANSIETGTSVRIDIIK